MAPPNRKVENPLVFTRFKNQVDFFHLKRTKKNENGNKTKEQTEEKREDEKVSGEKETRNNNEIFLKIIEVSFLVLL